MTKQGKDISELAVNDCFYSAEISAPKSVIFERKIMNRTFRVHDFKKMFMVVELAHLDYHERPRVQRRVIADTKVEALALCIEWYRWTRIQVILGFTMMAFVILLMFIGTLFYD